MPTFSGMKKSVLEIDKSLTTLERHFHQISTRTLRDVRHPRFYIFYLFSIFVFLYYNFEYIQHFQLTKYYISSRKNIFWPEWILKNGDSEKITSPGHITLTHSVFFSVLTDWIFLLKFNQRLLFQSQKKIKCA